MATNIANLFGQQQPQATPTKYSMGNVSYDPSVYQQALTNSDQFAAGQGWSGLDPSWNITGATDGGMNPSGFYAQRPLASGDTRNGYETTLLGLNPDGTINYDPNSWKYQEYKPDGGWLRPAATWAAGALGLSALGGALTAGGLAGAGGGAAGAGGTSSAVGGTGLAASAPGAATGAGFNFAGAAPGAIVGTGEGLGVATGAAGSAGAGLGAGIGASIPAGSALAGTALGGAGAGSGSGLASQFLGNAASTAGGGIVDAMKSIPGSNSIVSKLLGGALGGSGGVSGLGNLGSLFTNYNQYKQNQDIIDQIKGIYSPTGEYAKYLEGQLGRRDAAAGRNSQYGPRLAELTGRLAEGQASNLAKLSPFMQGQQGGLNGIVGAGSRLLQGAGGVQGLLDLFKGGSQGGMVPAPTTNGGDYIPNPDYNPVDDNWWTNPQAGP